MEYSILLGLVKVNGNSASSNALVESGEGTEEADNMFTIKTSDKSRGKESDVADANERVAMKTIVSRCGEYIYHICTIDYLQTHVVRKKLEIFWKTKFMRVKHVHLSSIDAHSYAKRFLGYL